MQAKEFGKKALKSLKQAFKRGPEVEAPARPEAPAPAHPRTAGNGAATPKAVPLHGWKGADAKKSVGLPAGAKIGAKRETPAPMTPATKQVVPASEVKAPAVESAPLDASGREKAMRRHSAPARINADRAKGPVTAKAEEKKVATVSKGEDRKGDENTSQGNYYSTDIAAVPRNTAPAESTESSPSEKTQNSSLGALVPKEESTYGMELYTSSGEETYTTSAEGRAAEQAPAARVHKSPDEESAFEYSNPEAVGPEYVDSEAAVATTQVRSNHADLENSADAVDTDNYVVEKDATNNYAVEEDATNTYVVEEDATNTYVVEEDATNTYVVEEGATESDVLEKGAGIKAGSQANIEAGVTNDNNSVEEVDTDNYVVEEEANHNNDVEQDADNYIVEDDTTAENIVDNYDDQNDELSSEQASKSEALAEPQKLAKVPDVQPVVPEHKDEAVAKLQGKLRDNAAFNKDVPERQPNRTVAVTRGTLSKTEQKSKGWANLPLRDSYRNSPDGNGRISAGLDHDLLKNGSSTQYFLGQVMKVDAEVRKLLASNLKAGRTTKREDTVLRLENGAFVDAKGEALDTTHVPYMAQAFHETLHKLEDKIQKANDTGLLAKVDRLKARVAELKNSETRPEATRKAGIAGRYIYVMNAAGDIFAGQSIPGVIHHSSFLAGGAVAGAGEIAISGGKVTAISNTSGHYRPGPAYLWQTVKQLDMLGVPLDSVRVDVMGVTKTFKNAKEFLGAFNPAEDSEMFDAAKAIETLNAYLESKSAKKHADEERAALDRADKLGKEETDGVMKAD